MITYPLEAWQMFVFVAALLSIVILLTRYLPAKSAVARLDTSIAGLGFSVIERTVAVSRSPEELVDVLCSEGYRAMKVSNDTFLLHPKSSLFSLKHIGLYWFQVFVHTPANAVDLQMKSALSPWGILLVIVTLWLTLSHRMPSHMNYLVFLVIVPDAISLFIMRRGLSLLARRFDGHP